MGASGSSPNPEKDLPSGSRSPSEEPRAEKRRQILIVEDNRADVFLIREAIQMSEIKADIQVAQDGEKAIRFFDEIDRNPNTPCPCLVILDINLPKKQGNEVLQHMRRSRRCRHALVIVVSTSDSAQDRDELMRLGADFYFRKPSDYGEFLKLGDVIRSLLANTAPPPRGSNE